MKKATVTKSSLFINQTVFLLIVLFIVFIFPNTEKGTYVINNYDVLLSIKQFLINKSTSFGLIDIVLIVTVGLLIVLINKFAFKPIISKYKPDTQLQSLSTNLVY